MLDKFVSKKGCACSNKNYLQSCEQLRKSKNLDSSVSRKDGLVELIAYLFSAIYNAIINSQIDNNCFDVPEFTEPLFIWKNGLFCAEQLNLNYLDLVMAEPNKNCPRGFVNCGVADDYENLLCIPQKYECPVSQLEFKQSLKQNEKAYKNSEENNKKSNKTFDNKYINRPEKDDNRFENTERKNKNLNLDKNSAAKKLKKQSEHNEENKRILSLIHIAELTSCYDNSLLSNNFGNELNANEDFYIKLAQSENENLLNLNSTNAKQFFIKNKFKQYELVKKPNHNQSLNKGEYAYNPYFTFNNEFNLACAVSKSETEKNNFSASENKTFKKFVKLDNIQNGDLYYQNNLLERVLSLPKFPKQNLLFNTTLFSQAYSGMDLSCRSLLLNLIKFETENFIEFNKNIESILPKFTFFIYFVVLILSAIMFIEYFLAILELEFLNKNPNGNFIAKKNEINLKIFGIMKIIELVFLIALNAHLRLFSNCLIYLPTNNFQELNYEKLLKENKQDNINNVDCESNANFKVFSDFYNAYFTVIFYITVISFVSIIIFMHSIIKFLNEYMDESSENEQLRENLNFI